MEKIWNFLNVDASCIINANKYDGMTNQWIEFRNLFMQDQMGFYMCALSAVTLVGSEMQSDFGILPFPKLYEEQTEYYSSLQYNNAETLSIPKTSSEIAHEGLLAEAYEMLAHDTILEAYYDYTLTLRNARDIESGEMLDIIFATRNVDQTLAFNSTTSMQSTLQSAGTAASFTFASIEAKLKPSLNKTLEKLFDSLKTIDQ